MPHWKMSDAVLSFNLMVATMTQNVIPGGGYDLIRIHLYALRFYRPAVRIAAHRRDRNI